MSASKADTTSNACGYLNVSSLKPSRSLPFPAPRRTSALAFAYRHGGAQDARAGESGADPRGLRTAGSVGLAWRPGHGRVCCAVCYTGAALSLVGAALRMGFRALGIVASRAAAVLFP